MLAQKYDLIMGEIGFIGAAVVAGAQARVAAAGLSDVGINTADQIVNKPFKEFSLKAYEDRNRVSSLAAFALMRACGPGMQARGRGRKRFFAGSAEPETADHGGRQGEVGSVSGHLSGADSGA